MFKLVRPVGAILLVGVTAFLVAADPPKEDAAKKDLESIQGTWKIVMLEADGEQAPAEIVATVKLVFKDDKLTFTPGEPGFTNYTYKLDPTAKPANFDMTHTDGANKGKTQKGIYSLAGDSLKICFGQADQRPKEFTAKANSGQAMYVLKREKP
jgi:uncharacterized protein (TIGR03067 family)